MNGCQWQGTGGRGVGRGGGEGGAGEVAEATGATGWILIMMELFCILIVVVDT